MKELSHEPTFFQYLTIVLGYSALILISLMFFIHFLRSGLDSRSSVTIDPLPAELDQKSKLTKKEKDKKR